MLTFGLALDFGTERATLDRLLEAYVPLLQSAERYGFRSVWAGESYPVRPGAFHLPSPLLVLAALARSTSLALGTGVTLVPAWHVLKLAYDAAILDQLSGGRLILGVGLGDPSARRRFGSERPDIGDLMDEMLAALRALWSGAPGFHGRLLAVDGGILPLPVQAGGPPLWVGGTVARAARRAARLGEAWYAATSYPLDSIRRQVGRYREALRACGKDPRAGRVSVNRLAFLAETVERARSEGGPYVEGVLRKYAAMRALPGAERAPATASDTPLLDTLGEALCLVGTPESAIEQLEAYAEAGVTDVQLRVAPSDMPPALVARTIALAGERVLPRFR